MSEHLLEEVNPMGRKWANIVAKKTAKDGANSKAVSYTHLSKRHQTNLLVTGKMFLRKLRKLLNVLVSQKQSVLILLEPQLSMNQKWFTTI